MRDEWDEQVAKATAMILGEETEPGRLQFNGWNDENVTLALIEAADQLGWKFVTVVQKHYAPGSVGHCVVIRAPDA